MTRPTAASNSTDARQINSTDATHHHLDCDVIARDRAHDRVTDVRALERGDRVLIGDRQRPVVVCEFGTRPQPLADGDVTQHAVEARGTWADAAPVLLVNEIHIDGTRTGRVSVDCGPTEPVWQVQR